MKLSINWPATDWIHKAVTVLRDITDDGNTDWCFCDELQKHESTKGHICTPCAAKRLVSELEAWEWERVETGSYDEED